MDWNCRMATTVMLCNLTIRYTYVGNKGRKVSCQIRLHQADYPELVGYQ
jgi:hypothetical protein